MEPYQIALLIVLVVCVLALFYIYFKNRQAEDTEEEATEAEEAGSGTVMPVDVYAPPAPEVYTPPAPEVHVSPVSVEAEPVQPVEAEPLGLDQHTIYAFEREIQVYVCPRCDGENSVNRHICCICGMEFRKGAW